MLNIDNSNDYLKIRAKIVEDIVLRSKYYKEYIVYDTGVIKAVH